MIFTEKEDRNNLEVSSTDKQVRITVDCQFGTLASVSFFHKKLKTDRCGEISIVGTAEELKGKIIEFNGTAGNPSGGQLKIIHTFHETDGNELVYTFPDDYTGDPEYNETTQVSYAFYVKFI